MEEKIIEAHFTKNKLARIVLIVGAALILFGLLVSPVVYATGEDYFDSRYGDRPYEEIYDDLGEFLHQTLIQQPINDGTIVTCAIYVGVLVILASLFYFWKMSRCALTVTNRRVTGKASFGKLVDLPLKQVSAVGLGAFGRITVASSSGKIHFWFIENIKEVYAALTDIIGKVQVEAVYAQNNGAATGNAAELKQYKELLDSGVITQEEFDVKKQQLLGL